MFNVISLTASSTITISSKLRYDVITVTTVDPWTVDPLEDATQVDPWTGQQPTEESATDPWTVREAA